MRTCVPRSIFSILCAAQQSALTLSEEKRTKSESSDGLGSWVVPDLTQGFVCDQPDPNPKNISKADLTQTQKKNRLESKTRIWQP